MGTGIQHSLPLLPSLDTKNLETRLLRVGKEFGEEIGVDVGLLEAPYMTWILGVFTLMRHSLLQTLKS